MFEHIQQAPPDAILGLTEAFRADSNPQKINLSVGVYQNSAGMTPKLACVKEAESRLSAEEGNVGYLPIDGLGALGACIQQLLFGPEHEIITSQRAATAQTPGGTGGLRVVADFLHTHFPDIRIWLPKPTWPNHAPVFHAAGLQTDSYTYYDAENHGLDFAGMMESLEQIPSGHVILLHGCCHNPSGVDLRPQQWQEVAALIKQRKLLPVVDFAYQGLGEGLTEDAQGVRILCQQVENLLICNSFSKNFGLYRERTGGVTIVSDSAATKKAVLSQVKRSVRANYSNPPYHGGAIVACVLGEPQLRSQWEAELNGMRDRINEIRATFADNLNRMQSKRDFSFIKEQRGMFSFSGLAPEQVERLRQEHSIYMVGNGRMNVAGMNHDNVDRVCQAITSVL